MRMMMMMTTMMGRRRRVKTIKVYTDDKDDARY